MSQVEKEQTRQSLQDWTHDFEPLVRCSIATNSIQNKYMISTSHPVMVFQSWVESVPILISYDHTIFSSVKCYTFFIKFFTLPKRKNDWKFLKKSRNSRHFASPVFDAAHMGKEEISFTERKPQHQLTWGGGGSTGRPYGQCQKQGSPKMGLLQWSFSNLKSNEKSLILW